MSRVQKFKLLGLPPDFGKTWRTEEIRCPNCEKVCDAATKMLGDSSGGPSPGSLSICTGCAAVNEFAKKEEGVLMLVPADLSRFTPEQREEVERLQHRVAARKN